MQTKRRVLLARALVAVGLVAAFTFPSSTGAGQPVALSVGSSTTTTLSPVSFTTSESSRAKLVQAIKDAVMAARPAPQPATKPKATVPVANSESQAVSYDSESIEALILSYFGTQSAINVAECESHLNPSAVSRGGGNWGLFQINTVHKNSFEEVTGHPWSDVLDAGLNTKFAKWLYDQSGGWGPWACEWAA